MREKDETICNDISDASEWALTRRVDPPLLLLTRRLSLVLPPRLEAFRKRVARTRYGFEKPHLSYLYNHSPLLNPAHELQASRSE
jgi:hypothetical protein